MHIGYLPCNRVVGISKLIRLIEVFARRLQVQEKMTAEIATCLQDVLKPHGVAVVVEGTHECMTTRGVRKPEVSMVTSAMLGVFRDRPETREEFRPRSICGAHQLPPVETADLALPFTHVGFTLRSADITRGLLLSGPLLKNADEPSL